MNTPVSLDDTQLELLRCKASLIPVQFRSAFLKAVAARLGTEPSTDALLAACDIALRLALPPNQLVNEPRKRGHHRRTRAEFNEGSELCKKPMTSKCMTT